MLFAAPDGRLLCWTREEKTINYELNGLIGREDQGSVFMLFAAFDGRWPF